MPYGTVKVDNITFDNGGADQNVTASGIYRAITSGVTVTGTISGAVLIGTTTVSGATVTGTAVQGTTVQGVSGTFTSLTGTTTTGTTANFVSGVFTTRISGTTVTGDTGQFTSGTFVSLTGTTITGTTINAVTVSSTTGTFGSITGTTITGTTINGATVNSTTGSFTSLTGVTVTGTTAQFASGVFITQVSGLTVTGTQSSFTSGNFVTLSGATATFTSGIIASGTAAAPSLAILGDPNTGIYSPGANQLAVATNGAGRLFVGSTGNIGLSEASPTARLHIVGTTTVGGIKIVDSSSSLAAPGIEVIGKRSDGNASSCFAGKLLLSKNRTDAAINSINVLGSVAFGGNHTDGTEANILYSASIVGAADGAFNSATDMPTALVFNTGATGRAPDTAGVTTGTERLRITSAGLVGIGTSTPATTLDVNGDITISDKIIHGGDTNTAIRFPAADTVTVETAGSERLRVDSAGKVSLTGDIEFSRTNPAAITVDDNGNITLSANSANTAAASRVNINADGLEVADFTNGGYLRFNRDNFAGAGICTQQSDNVLALGGGANPLNSGINIALSGPTRVSAVAYLMRFNTTNLYQWDKTSDFHAWNTGGSERLRITSSGRLLVGVAFDTGGALLQVNGDRIRVATAKTPASATATGTAGEICWDADYIYVCTATNTWKRTAISTW